jgi:hypothetical protein
MPATVEKSINLEEENTLRARVPLKCNKKRKVFLQVGGRKRNDQREKGHPIPHCTEGMDLCPIASVEAAPTPGRYFVHWASVWSSGATLQDASDRYYAVTSQTMRKNIEAGHQLSPGIWQLHFTPWRTANYKRLLDVLVPYLIAFDDATKGIGLRLPDLRLGHDAIQSFSDPLLPMCWGGELVILVTLSRDLNFATVNVPATWIDTRDKKLALPFGFIESLAAYKAGGCVAAEASCMDTSCAHRTLQQQLPFPEPEPEPRTRKRICLPMQQQQQQRSEENKEDAWQEALEDAKCEVRTSWLLVEVLRNLRRLVLAATAGTQHAPAPFAFAFSHEQFDIGPMFLMMFPHVALTDFWFWTTSHELGLAWSNTSGHKAKVQPLPHIKSMCQDFSVIWVEQSMAPGVRPLYSLRRLVHHLRPRASILAIIFIEHASGAIAAQERKMHIHDCIEVTTHQLPKHIKFVAQYDVTNGTAITSHATFWRWDASSQTE